MPALAGSLLEFEWIIIALPRPDEVPAAIIVQTTSLYQHPTAPPHRHTAMRLHCPISAAQHPPGRPSLDV